MFGRIILAVFVLIILGVATSVVMMVDTQPSVTRVSSTQVDNAETVHLLLRQLKTSLEDRHAKQTVEISQAQFESLLGFTQRAIPGFIGNVDIANSGTDLEVSVNLPSPLNAYFLNVDTQFLPGEGVNIDSVKIGDLAIPGDYALTSLVWVVDVFTQSDVASTAAEQITQITMSPGELVLDLRPLDELLEQINVARENFDSEVDELGLLTTEYLAYLDDAPLGRSPNPQSVASYLNLMLKRAHDLSDEGSAVIHNEAAVLALASFIGDYRVARLAGANQPQPNKAAQPKSPSILARRNDLARHFIISAALQILSQQNMTLAIGEFKELMDRGAGGSGFSFVDLAADMAGLRFAQVVSDPNKALRLQERAVEALQERDILPYIGGLREGLSKAEFEHFYGRVDSAAYREQVAEIESRINTLTLYKY